MSNSDSVKNSIRLSCENGVGRLQILVVDFVLATQHVQNQELSVMILFDKGSNIAVINLLSATNDFVVAHFI